MNIEEAVKEVRNVEHEINIEEPVDVEQMDVEQPDADGVVNEALLFFWNV